MDNQNWIKWALRYVVDYSLAVIPIGENKRPAIKWKEYQSRLPTIADLLLWPHENMGVVTGQISGIVIVDCESLEDAQWFWNKRGKTRSVAKTRRGYHLYFRHPGQRVPNATKVESRYDIRGDGGYVLVPPSTHSEGCYQWTTNHGLVLPKNLPVFRTEWSPPPAPATFPEKKVQNGVAYISKILAVAGKGGHANTYRAAVRLRQAGLNEMEAFLALLEWNKTNAVPSWSERELLHKLKDAYSK